MISPENALKFADNDARFGAFIIDWHIRTSPIALWGLWIFLRFYPDYWKAVQQGRIGFSVAWDIAKTYMTTPTAVFLGWMCVAIYFLYHPLIELLMHGNSPGKRWMHIKVVSLDGKRPTSGQIIRRNLWRIVEFLPVAYLWGMLAIIHSPERTRPGDIAAKTRVVKD